MLALRIAIFLLTLSLGIIASGLSRIEVRETPAAEPAAVDHTCHPTAGEPLERRCFKHRGDGIPSGSGTSAGDRPFESKKLEEVVRRKGNVTAPLKLISKQKADYTAIARTNETQGTVTLRVTFLASGSIGGITVIRSLPDGLTEKAIEAARKIRFEPEYLEGMPRSTSRPVSYTFNIY